MRRFGHREQCIGSVQRHRIISPGQPGRGKTAPARAAEQRGTKPLDPDADVGAAGCRFGAGAGDREAR